MRLTRDGVRTAIGRRTVRSVSKLLLGAASLLFVLGLASLLPGLDRLLFGVPVTFAAVVWAVAALAVAGLLVYAATGLAALARLALDGPREVVESAAAVVYWTVVLAAILIAHRGLAPALTPLLDGLVWAYDLVFLLAALAPLAVIAARLSVCLDPAADAVAERIAGTPAAERSDASGDDDGIENA